MAVFEVKTTREEQNALVDAIRKCEGEVISVAALAKRAGIKQSRARYALDDLIEAGTVRREATKCFNEHYVRYAYFVNKRGGE